MWWRWWGRGLTELGVRVGDTYLHSWEVLAQILEHEECQDILLDVGMYVPLRANPLSPR